MTLVWYERSSAQWEAPVVGGSYFIERYCFDGERPWFTVTYCDEREKLIGTASTLGWARVIAGEHHLELLAARPRRPTDPDIAVDTAAAREVLRQAEAARRPCEQCLRQPPCRVRCLRSLGVAERPEPETIRRKLYVDLANAPPWLRKILHEHFPDPNKVLIEELEPTLRRLRRQAYEREDPKP